MVGRLLLRAELRHGARSDVAALVVLTGVATALTLAAVLGRVASDPWDATWRASGRPHVSLKSRGSHRPLTALAGQDIAASRMVPDGNTGLRAGRWHVVARLVARHLNGPGRPVVVEGSAARMDEVLLERSFARAVGVEPGDAIALDTPGGPRRTRVSGLAVVSDRNPYPRTKPGLAFVSPSLLYAIVPSRHRGVTMWVRLTDAAAAPALADRLDRRAWGLSSAQSWRDWRSDVDERLRGPRLALALIAALLVLCAAPIVMTLVSERILARSRELAVLRAAGVTPGTLVRLTAVLYGALGAAGGVLGLAAGTLLAPAVAGSADELVTAPGRAAPALAAALAIVAGTAGLAALAAAVPAWLLGRRPAAAALVPTAAAGPRRRSRLARAARSARLPLPVVLGAGEAFARRSRALLAIVALGLSVAAVVCALAARADQDADARRGARPSAAQTAPFTAAPTVSPEGRRARRIVYAGAMALIALALANLVASLVLALREDRRDAGILRSVGLTARDAALAVTSRQLVLALTAIVVGIPLGLVLWRLGNAIALDSAGPITDPSPLALAAAAAATLVASALVTAPLARHAGRAPVTDVLRQE